MIKAVLLKKARSNWWGFTSQLFLVTVLPLTALVLLVAFGSQSLHHDAMRSLVGDRDLRAVRAAAGSLEQEILHRVMTVQMFAREYNPQAGFQNLSLNQAEISAFFDGGIALFSADRELLAASQPAAFWAGLKTSLPGYFEELAQQKTIPVFSPPQPAAGGNPIYVLVGSETPGGQFMLGAFSPAALVQSTLDLFTASGHITALVIARGADAGAFNILYQAGSSPASQHLLAHPGLLESLNGQNGINYFHSDEGEHVVAYAAVAPIGWGLVIEEAWEDISSPNLNTTQAAPLVVVPLLLLSVVALWFGVRRIVRPLQSLEKQAAELAEGDYEAIRKPVGGIEEIRNLQAELIEMADKLNESQQNLHRYIGAITAGAENERRSLARELHDDTIQSLIALNQRLQLAEKSASLANEPETSRLQAMVQQAMTNLRRMIRGLRPIYLEDLGLAASLEMLAGEISQAAAIPISFHLEGAERRLDPQVEMSIYRMVQECLNNIARHSQASQAWVELVFSAGSLHLEIRDNGKGFVVPPAPADFVRMGHYGLLGLQERAELLGAAYHLASTPGRGTHVTIDLKSI